eukprot:4643340-Amphidinium_carterae.1
MAAPRTRSTFSIPLVLALAAIAHIASRPALHFLESMEWADRGRLYKTDPLPLIAKVELGGLVNGGEALTFAPSRGSFLADFGILDIPVVGQVRARAGMRYSSLYPHGALELACRKEGVDDERGYEIFAGLQSTSDDNRMDVHCEAGAIKHFQDARLFYSFNAGWGGKYGGADGWKDAGSSLGVAQLSLPPAGDGELTVGWRTRLLAGGDPNTLKFDEITMGKRAGEEFPLQSTPFIAYS